MQPPLAYLPYVLGRFYGQLWTAGSMQGLWTIPTLLFLPVSSCLFVLWSVHSFTGLLGPESLCPLLGAE